MSHLVPCDVVQGKLAMLMTADSLGRGIAQHRAAVEMAKVAGAIFAHAPVHADEEQLEKVAAAMVEIGELTPEEFQMLKEAGWGSALKGLFGGARKAIGGARKSVGGWFSKMKGRIRPGKVKPSPGKVSPKASVKPKVKAKPKASPYRDPAPSAPPAQPPGRVTPSKAEMSQGWGARPTQTKEVFPGAGASRSAKAPVPKAATPGKPGKVVPKSEMQQGWTGGQGQAPTGPPAGAGAAGAAKGKGGVGWGRVLPYAAAGGLAYGAYKGVPWAARQLEQTSTTPMAHGLGWSPVSYGYGHNPYGSGMASMGPGG